MDNACGASALVYIRLGPSPKCVVTYLYEWAISAGCEAVKARLIVSIPIDRDGLEWLSKLDSKRTSLDWR